MALAENPVTATVAFYARGHGEVPEIDPEAWRVHVHGAVDRELHLSLETLREALPEREVTATPQCAGYRRAGLIAIRDIPGEAAPPDGSNPAAEAHRHLRQERRLLNHLTWLLVAGTLPGVMTGAVIRVEWLSGERTFELIAAFVLLPLGLWLALGSQRLPHNRPAPTRQGRYGIWALSLLVGTIGGIYGIGGGSILAPILLAFGYSAYEVAPATLAATFLTSIGGIVTYQVLQATHGGAIAPDWVLGAFLGLHPRFGSFQSGGRRCCDDL